MECKYGHVSPDGSRFCNTCGVALPEISKPDSELQHLREQLPGSSSIEKPSISEEKPWYKSKLIYLPISLIILVGFASANSNDDSTAPDASQTQTSVNYLDSLQDGVVLKDKQLVTCAPLRAKADELSIGNSEILTTISNSDGATRDGRTAISFLEKNPLSTASKFVVAFDDALKQVVSASLSSSFVAELSTELLKALTEDTLAICDTDLSDAASAKIGDQRQIALDLDNKVSSIVALAASVPWYPGGFSEFDANTAYKYDKGSCDYFDCYNISIVSKTSCSLMYAEMTLLDSSGANVGFTNDTATSVQPNQIVKLRFDVIEASATQGRLTQVTCG